MRIALHTPIMFLIVLLGLAPVATAEDVRDEPGPVSFESSATGEARTAFLDGLRLLHLFEYPRARTAFRKAREHDPAFVLAYWGEAMTHFRPLWGEEDVGAARAVLEALAPSAEARRAKARSEREAAWLAAFEHLLGDGEPAARLAAYEQAMGRIAAESPDDVEARAFHALAILGTARGIRERTTYDRAAKRLEPLFAEHPHHPGVAHYLVHCYDDPDHAHLGVEAAHALMRAAPASSHALHMASHIYLPLGRWQDVIRSNEAAWRASGEGNHHALQWLAYARLQVGDVAGARKALDTMQRHAARLGTPKARLYLALMRAAHLVEADACDAEVLAVPVDLEGLRLEFFAAHYLADGVCAWRAEKPAGIPAARERLQQAVKALADAPDSRPVRHGRTIATLVADMLAALEDLTAGREEQGLERLRAAQARQESLPEEYGPPNPPKPVGELLGDVLRMRGQHAEAVRAYRASLDRHPRRRASLAGLRDAAEAAGDTSTAREASEALASLGRD